MIELVEFFVRTPTGKLHRAMKDPTGQSYAWKNCRIGEDFKPVTNTELEDIQPELMCTWCIRPLSSISGY
jgi:hypothetical protein